MKKRVIDMIRSEMYRTLLRNASSLQEQAIIELLTGDKIWPSALPNIKLEDLDLITGELATTEGMVKLRDSTTNLLAAYIETERSLLEEQAVAVSEQMLSQLFICLTAGKIMPLEENDVDSLLCNLAEKAGIDRYSLDRFLLTDYIIVTHAASAKYIASHMNKSGD